MLSIGNVATMFGVSQFALLYYEWRGLIARRSSLDGQKVYGWGDCERLAFIIKARRAGLPLRGIIAVIEAVDEEISATVFRLGQETCMELVGRLEGRRKALDEALAELNHLYTLLTAKMLDHDRGPRRRRD